MNAVLDANAAVAVTLEHAGYKSVLKAIDSCELVFAPELFVSEVANVMWKYVNFEQFDKESAARRLADVLRLVNHYAPTSDYIKEAFFEACNNKHPVYDMLYLTLARRQNAALISLDKKLTLLAAKLGIAIYFDPDQMA